MRIKRKEMVSLQKSFLKPVVPMDTALITQINDPSSDLKTEDKKHVKRKIPQEPGEWDRAWLQKMDLLSIYFESKSNPIPKPVTVLDPEGELVYNEFVTKQEKKILEKKEKEREERRKNLPKDPRKRKLSENQGLPIKRKNVGEIKDEGGMSPSCSESGYSTCSSNEGITPFVSAPETKFQTEEYRRFKEAYHLHQPSEEIVHDQEDQDSSDETEITDSAEIPGNKTLDFSEYKNFLLLGIDPDTQEMEYTSNDESGDDVIGKLTLNEKIFMVIFKSWKTHLMKLNTNTDRVMVTIACSILVTTKRILRIQKKKQHGPLLPVLLENTKKKMMMTMTYSLFPK